MVYCGYFYVSVLLFRGLLYCFGRQLNFLNLSCDICMPCSVQSQCIYSVFESLDLLQSSWSTSDVYRHYAPIRFPSSVTWAMCWLTNGLEGMTNAQCSPGFQFSLGSLLCPTCMRSLRKSQGCVKSVFFPGFLHLPHFQTSSQKFLVVLPPAVNWVRKHQLIATTRLCHLRLRNGNISSTMAIKSLVLWMN